MPTSPVEFAARPGTPSLAIPLPVGSCLVLGGAGADVAMHCVPRVARRRISVTLRRVGPAAAAALRAARAAAGAPPPAPPFWAAAPGAGEAGEAAERLLRRAGRHAG